MSSAFSRGHSYNPKEMLEGSKKLVVDSAVRIKVGNTYQIVGYMVKSLCGNISVPRFAQIFELGKDYTNTFPFINYPFIDKFVSRTGVNLKFNLKDESMIFEVKEVSNGRMREVVLPETAFSSLGKVYIYERNVPINGNRYNEGELFFVTEYELYNLLQREKYKGCARIGAAHPNSGLVIKENWINYSLEVCRISENGIEQANGRSCLALSNLWDVNEGCRVNNVEYSRLVPIKAHIVLYQGIKYFNDYTQGKIVESDRLKYNNSLKTISEIIDRLS